MVPGPTLRQYSELIPMGTLKPVFRFNNYASRIRVSNKPSILATHLPDEWSSMKHKTGGYFMNMPTYKNVEKSEMRMDEVRPWPQSDARKEFALTIIDQMLEVPLTHQPWTDEDVYEHVDLTKGPGPPFLYSGIKTRELLVQLPIWEENHNDVAWLKSLLPVHRVVPKQGTSEISDLVDEKIRTYVVPGYHLLHNQLKCYGQGNENLKRFWWSDYGFNPFMGGAQSIFNKAMTIGSDGKLKYPIRFATDVKGYDRKISLHTVADRRYRCFQRANPTSKLLPIAKWVADSLKTSVVIFTNGDVCMRVRGNNSGSGMTTANNIEAGMEVFADLLVSSYYAKYGELPPAQLVIDQLIHLYGDDNLAFISLEFDYILTPGFIDHRLLYFHGLVLKFMTGGLDHPIGDLPFLGFTLLRRCDGSVIPAWKEDRLKFPLCYTNERQDDSIFLQQFFSILILSYAQDDWESLRTTFIKLLQAMGGHPAAKAIIRHGVPTKRDMEFFYLGRENEVAGPDTCIAMSYSKITLIPTQIEQDGLDYVWSIRFVGPWNGTLTATESTPTLCWNEMMELIYDKVSELYPEPTVKPIETKVNSILQTSKIDPNSRYELAQLLLKAFAEECTINRNKPRDSKEFKEGSFNPYGNGQPANMTFKQYAKLLPPNMTLAAKRKKYAIYRGAVNQYQAGPQPATTRRPTRTPNNNRRRYNRINNAPRNPLNSRVRPDGPNIVPVADRSFVKTMFAPCTANYLRYRVSPFDIWDNKPEEPAWEKSYGPLKELPCIPSFPPIMSRKVFTFLKGDFFAGTTGTAFIAFAPWRLAADYSLLQNDSPGLIYSTAASTSNTYPAMDTAAAPLPATGLANLNSDIDAAALVFSSASTSGIKYRVVAAGLRVTYTGTSLNMSGGMHICETPDHASLSTMSSAGLSVLPSYFFKDVNKEWTTLTYSPVHPPEFEYMADAFVNPITIASTNSVAPNEITRHHMGFLITGAQPSAPFRFEAITFLEVIGAEVRGKTRSSSDPTGLSKVTETLIPETSKAISDHPNLMKKVAAYAEGSVDVIMPSLKNMAYKMIESQTGLNLNNLGI